MMRTLSRRVFVALLAAVAAPCRAEGLGVAAWSAAQGTDAGIDRFLALSARLTGRAQLDPVVGRLYLDALLASPTQRGLLLDLLAGRSTGSAHSALERDIVGSWYTGVYDVKGERRVATHDGALVWTAIGRPAPGTCAGLTGDWAQPPGAR